MSTWLTIEGLATVAIGAFVYYVLRFRQTEAGSPDELAAKTADRRLARLGVYLCAALGGGLMIFTATLDELSFVARMVIFEVMFILLVGAVGAVSESRLRSKWWVLIMIGVAIVILVPTLAVKMPGH